MDSLQNNFQVDAGVFILVRSEPYRVLEPCGAPPKDLDRFFRIFRLPVVGLVGQGNTEVEGGPVA